MKYIKTYEKNHKNIKIGDYVITNDIYNIRNNNKPNVWHQQYGIIIDIGKRKGSDDVYLVKFFHDLSDIFKEFIEQYKDSYSDIISKTNHKVESNENWFCEDYLIIYNNKQDFDDVVEEIEVSKSVKKYNL